MKTVLGTTYNQLINCISDICSVVFTRIERIVVTSSPWESAVLWRGKLVV